MKTEYAVEVYNKYHDNFVEQIDVFETYEEALAFIKKRDFDFDENSEYLEVTEIEYNDEGNEIATSRVGLVADERKVKSVCFEADDCNDPMWDKIFEVLKKSDLGLLNVFYLEGDRMELMFKDTDER